MNSETDSKTLQAKRRGRRMRLLIFVIVVGLFMASGFWLATELVIAGG